MAIMHPEDIENYKYTGSEKEMYDQLKSQLPDKMHVFYSIRWFETKDGVRVDSESDFLVFDPSFGFITIEVKGGIGLDVSPDNTNWVLHEIVDGELSHRELHRSPYLQSEESMRHFTNYFREEFAHAFRGAYGFAVAFPFYYADKIISDRNPKEVTIDKGDMNSLKDKINSIFHYWKKRRNLSVPFSGEERKRFISLINKRISLSAAAGALIDIKKKQFEKINMVQDNILDALCNYPDLQFVGGAGTGKTYIGVKKAMKDSNKNCKVLITCVSETLSAYINTVLLNENSSIICKSFSELLIGMRGQEAYNKSISQELDYLDIIGQVKDDEKYDSIIVDEAQDFDEDMGLCIASLLKDNHKTFYVFFDENQNLYNRDFGTAFGFNSLPIVLRYNIRNTGRIYDYATKTTNLGKETISNELVGVEPDISNFNSEKQALNKIEGIVNKLTIKEYVPVKSIVLLSNVPYEQSVFRNQSELGQYKIDKSQKADKIISDDLHYYEINNFKGLESDVVIFVCHKKDKEEDNNQCERYVALTRARYFLYIVNIITK